MAGNGINGRKSTANPVLAQGAAGSWGDKAVSMPYVLNDGGHLCMIYSGDMDDWDGGILISLDVLWTDGTFHIWYAARAAGLS